MMWRQKQTPVVSYSFARGGVPRVAGMLPGAAGGAICAWDPLHAETPAEIAKLINPDEAIPAADTKHARMQPRCTGLLSDS